MSKLKKGDRVTIINQNTNGEPIIEGEATLISETKNLFSDLPCWKVKFDGEGEPIVLRTIYPEKDISPLR
jgi:hypothetical protein